MNNSTDPSAQPIRDNSDLEKVREWRDAIRAGGNPPWPLELPAWVERVEVSLFPHPPAYGEPATPEDIYDALVDYFGREHRSGTMMARLNQCYSINVNPKRVEEFEAVYVPAEAPRVELWPETFDSFDLQEAFCASKVLRAAWRDIAYPRD